MSSRRIASSVLGWGIVLILVGSLLASLRPGGRSTAASRRPIDPGKLADPQKLHGHVTAWGWNIAAKSMRSLVPDFQKRYPNVDVNVEMTAANIQTRFLLSLAAGEGAPDVMMVQLHEAPRYIATGRMADLTAVAAKYQKDFPPAAWANCTGADGHVYAIPWDVGPCGVFYKRDLFAHYGIDPEKIETWDDYLAAGRKMLKESGGRTKILPLGTPNLVHMFEMMLRQLGGQVFDAQGRIAIDSPEGRQVLDRITQLRDAGICAEVEWFKHEWLASFNDDTIASYPLAVWLSGTIKDTPGEYTDKRANWGLFKLPAMEPGGRRSSNLGGSSLTIPDQCENKEAAFAFIEYALCTRAGQVAQFRNYNIFPAYLPALEDPFFKQPDPFFGGQPLGAFFAEGVKDLPVMYRTPDWTETQDYMIQGLTGWATAPVASRPSSGELLHTLAGKLHRRLGREIAK